MVCIRVVHAQKSYFQQETNFNISVSLDDEKHILVGNESLEYINHSPNDLSFIYFHLWMNAFDSKKSAFAQQQLRNGNTKFYFSDEKDMGYITDLDFKIDGKKCEVEIDKDNPDIAKIILQQPLKAGEKITITTPFKAKIPKPFSRAGHIGQQYLITQWFPKPAVYDTEGWHPMPYLDFGEFYSEFGKYDVSITLPKNYVIGATGTLETESEKEFLTARSKISVSDTVPISSKETKTIRYTAENVHDFAWFADKAFNVLKSETTLKNGKKVETYAYFRAKYADTWAKATEYINRAVKNYSDWVGDYPHPHASAVMANEGFEGGMEYPMITVLSGRFGAQDLDITIAHEVGHNWFQGILGTNERDYAWMDEGINSFYEKRYNHEFYPNTETRMYGVPSFFFKKSDYSAEDIVIQHLDFNHKNQPIQTTSNEMNELNYFMNAYEKPARLMKVLESTYGKERFDKIMHAYFEAWKFKHPQPADFRKHWETETGDNLSWFFEGFLTTTQLLDYKITNIKSEGSDWLLTVQNNTKITAPFTISGLKNNKVVFEKSFKGIENQEVIKIAKGDFDALVLDNRHILPDVDRSNNYANTTGNGSISLPLKVKILGGLDDSKAKNLYWSPAMGINAYDGTMLGLAFHNGFLPEKKFNWLLVPMYGLQSKKLDGVAQIGYNTFVKNHKITFEANGRKFAYKKTNNKNYLNYTRITPSVTIDFWRKPVSQFVQSLSFRHGFLSEAQEFKDSIEKISIKNKWFHSSEISYMGKIENSLRPTSFRIAVEKYCYQMSEKRQSFLKTTLEVNQSYKYKDDRFISARVFIAGFPLNSARNSGLAFTRGFLGLSARGFSDYRYDDYYFGRNELKGFLSRQVSPNTEGGLKFALPEGEEKNIGYSNNFVAAVNMKAQLPFKLPLDIKPYFDFGFFSDTRPGGERSTSQWLASGGLCWEVNDYLGIYAPFYFSGKSSDPNSFRSIMMRKGDFLSRITFSLNIKKLDLRRLINNL